MEKLPASWLPREAPRAPSALSSWPQAPGWAAGRWWPSSPKVSGPGCSGACALGGRRCRGGHMVPRTRAQPPAGRSKSTFQPDILCLTVPRVWAGDVGGLPLPGLECSSPCRVVASIAHWTSILPFPLGAGTPLAFCWWLGQGHPLPYFVSRNSH